MQDNDNYEEFENNEYENVENLYCPFLYFLNGDYIIRLVSELNVSADTFLCTFIVQRTPKESDSKKSLFDVFTMLENSFLLEFLISTITMKLLNIESVKKIISASDTSVPCICVTATFSTNQNYLHIEDEIESDESATDILMVGKTRMMRTHQYFYCTTQAAKYCIIKYDAIDKFNWNAYGVDWYNVYVQLIEPYIKYMISSALKCQVDSVMQHSDYMTFYTQFAINTFRSSFYAEIYLLPKTVLNHKIIYNAEDGREILIGYKSGNDSPAFSSDTLRLCLGSQNLNLIPINNLNTKVTLDNYEPYVVTHEISKKDDPLINYFALPIDKYTRVPSEFCVYLDTLRGFDGVVMDLPVNDKSIQTAFFYLSLLTSNTKSHTIIKISEEVLFCGVLTFAFQNKIPNNVYNHTMLNSDKDMFIPKEFFDRITMAYNFDNTTKYSIIPIRALPQYREYMLFAIKQNSDDKESQSDIISKNESENNNPSKKKGFFSSLFK